MRVLESMGLKVKKPMVLEIDNKGAVDIAHNWSVSGRLRHDSIRHNFLRELNEERVIEVFWIATEDNSADLFTKNLMGPAFERHAKVYCGEDEYMISEETKDSQREGVGDEKSTISDRDVIPKYVESRRELRDNTKVKSTSGIKSIGGTAILDSNKPKPRSNPSHKHMAENRRKAIQYGMTG
jgi:hypothetical protein